MTAHARNTTSHTYGSNYTIMPAHVTITRAQLDMTRAHADAAPRELRPLYSYQHYDDAVAIYRRCAHPIDEHDTWDLVGAILFAPSPDQADALDIFAFEISDGFERGDVERHILMLFGADD
jgi:hypothetical protein